MKKKSAFIFKTRYISLVLFVFFLVSCSNDAIQTEKIITIAPEEEEEGEGEGQECGQLCRTL